MKVYNLIRKQFLPITLQEAWLFFSTPKNLARITPLHMEFKIIYTSGDSSMYAGQIIGYKIKVLPLLKVNWITEITHVHEPYYFVDEQRFGPYALWHHQHHFKEVNGGVEMIDEVNYALPYSILGRLAHTLFVERELNRIFDYRFKVLEEHFKKSPRNLVWS